MKAELITCQIQAKAEHNTTLQAKIDYLQE